jgi:anti-sigma factor RsiW
MRIPFFRGHSRWEAMVDASVDGALSPREAARLEAHRSACAACSRALEATLALKAALATLPEVEAPRSFRLTPAMVAAKPAVRRPGPPLAVYRFAQAAGGVALAAFVAVVVIDLGDPGRGGDGDNLAAGAREAAPADGLDDAIVPESGGSGQGPAEEPVPEATAAAIPDYSPEGAEASGHPSGSEPDGGEPEEDDSGAPPADGGGAPTADSGGKGGGEDAADNSVQITAAPAEDADLARSDDEDRSWLRALELALGGLAVAGVTSAFLLARARRAR